MAALRSRQSPIHDSQHPTDAAAGPASGGHHPQFAHARMLEERPTPEGGVRLPVLSALEMLDGGQVVNCAVTSARPGAASATLVDAHLTAPGLPGHDPQRQAARRAAEVLSVNLRHSEATLALNASAGVVAEGNQVTLDFTDATGTFFISGTVRSVARDRGASVTVHLDSAYQVQLRRFVRVPVLIAPISIGVEYVAGHWRDTKGEIVDISLGGVGLLVSEPLPAGARIRVKFHLPGRFGEVEVFGRVIVPPGPAEAQAGQTGAFRLAHRQGIAFDPLAVDDLRRLQRALYHRQVELRRVSEAYVPRNRTVPALASEPQRDEKSATPAVRWRLWGRG